MSDTTPIRCEGRYPVPQTAPPRDEPFEVAYRCGRPAGHEGAHRSDDNWCWMDTPPSGAAPETGQSPRPWRVCDAAHGYGAEPRDLVDARNAAIGRIYNADDAALIVQSVNSHADLLAALRAMSKNWRRQASLTPFMSARQRWNMVADELDAAIRSAEAVGTVR